MDWTLNNKCITAKYRDARGLGIFSKLPAEWILLTISFLHCSIFVEPDIYYRSFVSFSFAWVFHFKADFHYRSITSFVILMFSFHVISCQHREKTRPKKRHFKYVKYRFQPNKLELTFIYQILFICIYSCQSWISCQFCQIIQYFYDDEIFFVCIW